MACPPELCDASMRRGSWRALSPSRFTLRALRYTCNGVEKAPSRRRFRLKLSPAESAIAPLRAAAKLGAHESLAPSRPSRSPLPSSGDRASRRHADRARALDSAKRGQGLPTSGPHMDAQDYWLDSIALALIVALVIVF